MDIGHGKFNLWQVVRQNKRPFRVLLGSPQSPSPEGMERLAMGGISSSESDARVEAADQGGVIRELDESGRASGIRGENACDEAVAAGDMEAAQDILDDGDGGGGGMAALGIPDRSTMSRVQWKNFKKKAAKNKGRK